MAELLASNEIFFTAFEPKVANRFILNIDGIPAYLIKAAGRPNINNNPITLDHINLKRKLKGKSEWQDITIQLYDPIVPSAAQAAMEWVRLAHESVTGRNGYADFYKKTVQIDVLGPVGDKVERWSLYGAFPNQVDFNTTALDWANGGDPLMVSITLSMDYCVLEY
jgi:hypothetical protein